MQMKAILFIVVVGAVAVLAKKGGSSEEDRNAPVPVYPNADIRPTFVVSGPKGKRKPHRYPQGSYGVLQMLARPRPGRGPWSHKFKGPKHQVFVVGGRPPYPQQQHYPQMPHFPPQQQYYPQVPQYVPEQQVVSPQEVQQYLELIQKRMQDFSAKAYKEFQMLENEIDRNRNQLEEAMKSQFQTLELSLEAKQAKEIEEAVKDGKDELKIQECMAEEEQDFRAGMDVDIQRTTDCLNDATERARKAVNDARNSFTESSVINSMVAKEWAEKLKYCAEKRDGPCVEEGMILINERTQSTVEEGSAHFQKLQDAPERQMIQMRYCRQNFADDLRDMRDAYSRMVKRCVVASEIQEPEEEAGEEADVQVKPEAEDEEKVGVEVEVKPDAEE